MAEPDGPEVTEDRLLGGRVRLLQPRRGHRAGTDAVLLAGLCGAGPDDRVADLGSASGAVGLMIAARHPDARITFLERDADLVELCRRNIAANGFAGRAEALEADVFGPGFPPFGRGGHDLVVTNPPFFDPSDGARPSPVQGRRSAHTMSGGDLRGWLAGAAALLRPRGRLALIHRADRLEGCLAALAPAFGSLEVVPIRPRAEADAARIVVRAVLGGRAPLRLRPDLTLHAGDGGFTVAARRLHENGPDEPTPGLEQQEGSRPPAGQRESGASQEARSASP